MRFPDEYMCFTVTADDRDSYVIRPEFDATRLTYTIVLKAVTVSGGVHFTTKNRPGSAKDALAQSGLTFAGFIGGDSYGSIRGELTSLELLHAEGNVLTQTELGIRWKSFLKNT